VVEVVPRFCHLVIEPGIQSRWRQFTGELHSRAAHAARHTRRMVSVRFHARLVQLPVGEGV
jgi:hypothetical protein